jgi:hypothetical protein
MSAPIYMVLEVWLNKPLDQQKMTCLWHGTDKHVADRLAENLNEDAAKYRMFDQLTHKVVVMPG